MSKSSENDNALNGQKKKLILIIDDDRANLMLAEEVLKTDYQKLSVISGKDALKFLERKIPDLILLDVDMPDMDGYEVFAKLQENENMRKIPVIFLTGNANSIVEAKCLKMGAVDFITKPFVPEIMLQRISRVLELEEYHHKLEAHKSFLENKLKDQMNWIVKMQQEMVFSMANMIESRDGNTGGHIRRTVAYVKLITRELLRRQLFKDELSPEYAEHLYNAAIIHDIGKIAVPDYILQKPGRLTPEEFEVMKTHTTAGGKLIMDTLSKLENERYIDIAFGVVVRHHEKWNGSGYPGGWKEDKIPLGARIMAVADVFDALVAKRCYKEAMSYDQAFGVIKESIGSHFDPVIGNIFLELRSEAEKIVL